MALLCPRSPARAAAALSAVAAAAALVLLVPRTTVALDVNANLGTMNGTRCDDVTVTTHVAREAKASSGWGFVIEAENGGTAPQTCVFQAAVERWFNAADIRVPSEVTTLYTRAESITVAPHDKARLFRELPAWLAPQLANAERLMAARAAAEREMQNGIYPPALRAAYPEFRVNVLEPHAKVERVRHAGGMPMPPPWPPRQTPPRDRDGSRLAEGKDDGF